MANKPATSAYGHSQDGSWLPVGSQSLVRRNSATAAALLRQCMYTPLQMDPVRQTTHPAKIPNTR